MAKIWTAQSKMNSLVEKFCFARDVELDEHLVYYDILGSMAHATMLEKIGILTGKELQILLRDLTSLWKTHQSGKWKIEVENEDVHSAVEVRLGKIGGKLHTARSRNDQVLTDMRLYMKDRLAQVALELLELAQVTARNAKQHQNVPMPGYTHLQRAMPSSYGMWLGAYAEQWLDARHELDACWAMLDQCPLGSGAGYGVPFHLDRELTAKLLGFGRVQRNSIYCQNSRGPIEAMTLAALDAVAASCSRLSTDVCLFCSQEFAYLNLPDAYFSGSSIMPQKKNPDLFELIRAKAATLRGLSQGVRALTHGLTSGYSKDLQEVKGPVMEAFDQCLALLQVLKLVIADMQPNKKKLESAMAPELFAAHRAYQLVNEGMPFRQAYLHVKEHLDELQDFDAVLALSQSTHIGGTGNLMLKELLADLGKEHKKWQNRHQALAKVWARLLER